MTAVEYTHKLAESALGPCFLQFGDEFEIVKVHTSLAIVANLFLNACVWGKYILAVK